MKRILNAYSAKFRTLTGQVGARKIDKAMDWFYRRAEERKAAGVSVSEALESVYREMRKRIGRIALNPPTSSSEPVVFVCDVGLGGLARWLRAAGYMAYWREGVGDAELIDEARARSAILLTTDGGMMERRILRDGHWPAIWLSPGLTKLQQLASVFGELDLPRQTARCMDCGGELERAEKHVVADRIPPKTFRWREVYFLCKQCGKLFWHGSHWQRIDDVLDSCIVKKEARANSGLLC